jgi:hypothetical protein
MSGWGFCHQKGQSSGDEHDPAQRMNGFRKMDGKTWLAARANTLRSQLELTLIDEINR